MKSRKSLDLEELWKAIQKREDTTSAELAQQFDCSTAKILDAVHQLEEMHKGKVAVHHLGVGACLGKSKKDIDRYLLCDIHCEALAKRARHIAINTLVPAGKRIGRTLLSKAIPERRLLALESRVDYLAEWKKKEDEGIVGSFTFTEDGKMMRGFSAGKE